MRGFRKLLMIAPLMAFLLSSCIWTVVAISYSDNTIVEGEATKVRISVRPDDAVEERMYVFVIVGVSDVGDNNDHTDDFLDAKTHTWDVQDVYNGPKTMVSDPLLLANILAEDDCASTSGGINLSDEAGVWYELFRTPAEVNDRAWRKTAKIHGIIDSRSNAGSTVAKQVVHAVGVWPDTEDDEDFSNDDQWCTGGAVTFLHVKNP